MAYPLPGFGRDPTIRDQQQRSPFSLPVEQAQPGEHSYVNRQSPALQKYISSCSSINQTGSQTVVQVAQINAARIVSDPELWVWFKAMIRQHHRRDGSMHTCMLPTTNLLTMQYLHKCVEQQFELEAEQAAQREEELYPEWKKPHTCNDNSKDQDGGRMLQKAAKWISGSFSILDTKILGSEGEGEAIPAAEEAYEDEQGKLANMRGTTAMLKQSPAAA
mmetsp:Transcript_29587/g.65171  ORF Transcript_29587/g.65171 Transcript_29587/m.65171 type:complete len:219 (-) Transcript_29587:64-720(-)